MKAPNFPEPGRFPFPATNGYNESPYLTWIRNHSNYMAVQGFYDYLRAVAVLLRGILGNFLIFTPYLLIIAMLVAAMDLYELPPPFSITTSLIALFLGWILLFLVLPPFYRIVKYKVVKVTGSDSSVEQRDLYERSFGIFVFVIAIVATIELMPTLLTTYHKLISESALGWPKLASFAAGATAIFSIAPKVLSHLKKGLAKKAALLAIGLLGLMLPLMFVLFVADYLRYGDMLWWEGPLKSVGFIIPSGIIFAAVLGWTLRVFNRKDALNIVGLVILGLIVVMSQNWLTSKLRKSDVNKVLNTAMRELQQRPAELQSFIENIENYSGEKLKKQRTWSKEFDEYLFRKRALLRDINSKKEADLKRFGQYLEEKNTFFKLDEDPGVKTDKRLLKASLQLELLEESRNAAFGLPELSSLVTLSNAIADAMPKHSRIKTAPRDFTEHENQRLFEIVGLYRRIAKLQDLLAEAPLAEFVGRLILYSRSDIAFSRGFKVLPREHKEEYAQAKKSLQRWSDEIIEVKNEISRLTEYADSEEHATLIGSLAGRPNSKLGYLIRRLEKNRRDMADRRDSLAEDQDAKAEALVPALTHIGHNVRNLYPLVHLSGAIRKSEDPYTDELAGEARKLYRRSLILDKFLSARSLEGLARNMVGLRIEDLKILRGSGLVTKCKPLPRTSLVTRIKAWWVQALEKIGYERNCDAMWLIENREPAWSNLHPDYPILSSLEGFIRAENMLVAEADFMYSMRDELVAFASVWPRDSAYYGTPAASAVRPVFFKWKLLFVGTLAVQLWFLCWLTIDVNLTSIHGLYRDRLASAFLIGRSKKKRVQIEPDVDLMDLCNHDAGSVAPYHIINVALNLQGSKAQGIRDRQSDFFIFSKRFIGGRLTGYCPSESMERVFPQMDLATAMAISAAAASPNMGRGTSPALVAIMTLLNIRLGYWLPNPGLIHDYLENTAKKSPKADGNNVGGLTFEHVFRNELGEIKARWEQLKEVGSQRRLAGRGKESQEPTPCHGLVGIGYSGGGIRSATLNLGITQALHQRGIFAHVDYMSTVSGGGYLGSSISTLMRCKTRPLGADERRHARRLNESDSISQTFRWRVRPAALMREIASNLNEKSRLVNVSDGGHIENLAGIELLRRQCKYIIIGDGEADPRHEFSGLATLVRTARVDLGYHIEISTDELRINKKGLCKSHWAIGRIDYPEGHGYLLYLKSSMTGNEDVVINQYRDSNPSFPHESTADQFFDEGQFEAYRSLGQHICESVLPPTIAHERSTANSAKMEQAQSDKNMSYVELGQWLTELWSNRNNTGQSDQS